MHKNFWISKTIAVSRTELQVLLSELDVNTAFGTESVHPRVLKECSEQLSIPPILMFHKWLDFGKLPSYWSKANLTPLLKKGNNTDTSNSRPVSLTSVVCKVKDRLMVDLNLNNLISTSWHSLVVISWISLRPYQKLQLRIYVSPTKQSLLIQQEWAGFV